MEKPAVEARIAYLEKVKALRAEKSNAASFTMALKEAFPDMLAYYESKGCEVKTLADYKQ